MYANAKKAFEALVQKMQTDVAMYANKPGAKQGIVNSKVTTINAMVDFYQAAEMQQSEIEMLNTEILLAQSKLLHDTERLIYWCKLHRVNPNAVFKYDVNELRLMVESGRRFGYPQDISQRYPTAILLQMQKQGIDPELCCQDEYRDDYEEFNLQTEKYLNTLLIKC